MAVKRIAGRYEVTLKDRPGKFGARWSSLQQRWIVDVPNVGQVLFLDSQVTTCKKEPCGQ